MEKVIFFNYDGIFHSRLRDLIEEHDITKQKLSEEIGVSRQAISQYCDGSTIPNADKLLKIAEFFNVSTDYLLGSTEAQTTDTDIKFMCEYTGIKDTSINNLHYLKEGKRSSEFFLGDKIPYDYSFDFLDFLFGGTEYYNGFSLLSKISEYKNMLISQTENLLKETDTYSNLSKEHIETLNFFSESDKERYFKREVEKNIAFCNFEAVKMFEKVISDYLSNEIINYNKAFESYEQVTDKYIQEVFEYGNHYPTE